MTLNILVVEDNLDMLGFYREVLKEHHVTEVQFADQLWSMTPEPFDLAFLDFKIDPEYSTINGIGVAELVREWNEDITTVLVTGHPEVKEQALESGIDVFIEKGGTFPISKIEEVIEKVEKENDGSGPYQLDFWDRSLIKEIDAELEGSKIRSIADQREDDLKQLINRAIHDLRGEYHPEGHFMIYASLMFARVAGYDLSTNGNDLYKIYQKTIRIIARDEGIEEEPDFSRCQPSNNRRWIKENHFRFTVYGNRLETAMREEIDLRLNSLSTKGNFNLTDRAIAAGCLAYCWAVGVTDIKYQNKNAFMAFDRLMSRHDKETLFYENL